MDKPLLYVFRPNEESQVLYKYRLYNSTEYPEWTYAYDVIQDSWYVCATKDLKWMITPDTSVPKRYRLELLLLQAAHS